MRTTPQTFLLILVALFITSFNASAADPECAPNVLTLVRTNATFTKLNTILNTDAAHLKTLLDAVKDQPTYTGLLNFAKVVATTLPKSRLLIALPDGTVVVDTSKPVDPTNKAKLGNSFKHFTDKTVNENHNSRIAILDSQLHVCGIGVENKLSTTDDTKESYVARRLGAYLNNSGTARLSIKQ